MAKKQKSKIAWQCQCGHIEYADIIPEDCQKCFRIDSFLKVPEDELDEILEGEVLSSNSCPYKGYAASRRNVSLAPKPHGVTPAFTNSCQMLIAFFGLSIKTSNPSSPV